jgi:hypothetical protein
VSLRPCMASGGREWSAEPRTGRPRRSGSCALATCEAAMFGRPYACARLRPYSLTHRHALSGRTALRLLARFHDRHEPAPGFSPQPSASRSSNPTIRSSMRRRRKNSPRRASGMISMPLRCDRHRAYRPMRLRIVKLARGRRPYRCDAARRSILERKRAYAAVSALCELAGLPKVDIAIGRT